MTQSSPGVDETLLGRYIINTNKFYDVLGDAGDVYVFRWGLVGVPPQGKTAGADAALALTRIQDKVQRGYTLLEDSPRFTPAGQAQRQAQGLERVLPDAALDAVAKPRF